MTPSICTNAESYLRAMGRLLGAIDHKAIDKYAALLFEAWHDQRHVFVFGNGGSACTASHHVLDYVKTAAVDGQPRLRAISLVDHVGLTTAVGNDLSYEETFRFSLSSFAKPCDVAVAISCSGNSTNVVKACEWAKDNGLTVVALSGFSGGRIGQIADLHINVASENYGLVEDFHLMIGHVAAQTLHARIATMKVQV